MTYYQLAKLSKAERDFDTTIDRIATDDRERMEQAKRRLENKHTLNRRLLWPILATAAFEVWIVWTIVSGWICE